MEFSLNNNESSYRKIEKYDTVRTDEIGRAHV